MSPLSSSLFTIYLYHSLHRNSTLLIQYDLYINIVLSDSSNCSQKFPLKFFFLPFFLKSSNLIFFFYTIAVFDLIRKFVSKIFYFLAKKSNWLVNKVFEICFDSKIPVWGEILKKMSTIIRNSPTYFENFNLITSQSSFSKVVDLNVVFYSLSFLSQVVKKDLIFTKERRTKNIVYKEALRN